MGRGSRIIKRISGFIWENKKDIAIIVVALIVLAGAGWVIIRIATSVMNMLSGVMQWISPPSTPSTTTPAPTQTQTTTPSPTTTTTPASTTTTTAASTTTTTTPPSGPWI